MRLSVCESVFLYKSPRTQQTGAAHCQALSLSQIWNPVNNQMRAYLGLFIKANAVNFLKKENCVWFPLRNIKTTLIYAATVAATLKDRFEGESMQRCRCGCLYGEKRHISSLSPCCVVGKFDLLYRNWWSTFCKHPHSFQLVVIRLTCSV